MSSQARGTAVRIVEDGTVVALLASGGRFAEFWRQQEDAVGWRIAAKRT